MKATIEINGLRLFANHGVFEEERINGNTFEVTAHIDYPVRFAAESDDVDDTLNYAEAVELIQQEMASPSNLLENAAQRIYSALTQRWPRIEGGMIRLTKLFPPIDADMDGVAVTLRW